MSTSRIKLTTPKIIVPANREEAEGVVRAIAELKISERKLKAEMDAKLTEIKKAYEARLSVIAESITPQMESIHAWADANEAEFGGRRSLDMLHGVIGWRTTPPALKPLKGFTWAAVLGRLTDMARFDFIRTKEEPNKEAILAARQNENLKQFYVQVVQEDEFFVEPALSETTARETKE